MQAAIVTEPGHLAVQDIAPPGIAGPYDMACTLLFGSICAATDRHLVAGKLPIPGITYPLILGHESIGRVEAVGEKVRNFAPGDLVSRVGVPARDGLGAFWGGFAEQGIARDVAAMREDGVDEAEWAAHAINLKLPRDIDPAHAPMLITWRETTSYLARLGVPEGGAVLVLGSGGNGFAFAVLARLMGAARVAMLGNPHWADHAARAGVDPFEDYRDPDAMDRLRAALPGGFDVIVDAIGKTGGLEAALPMLKPGGAAGLYGIEDIGERMGFLKQKADDPKLRLHGPMDYAEPEAHERVLAWMAEGRLTADLWFDPGRPHPLAAIGDALDDIAARRSLKALVKLGA